VLPSDFKPEKITAPDGMIYEKHTALLQLGQRETLRKGDLSVLTEEVGNIHNVMPTQFSQVLDIFTPAYNEENEKAARWYQTDERDIHEGREGVYRAEYYKPV
jgi:hypothetical protein